MGEQLKEQFVENIDLFILLSSSFLLLASHLAYRLIHCRIQTENTQLNSEPPIIQQQEEETTIFIYAAEPPTRDRQGEIYLN